jgi:hypothetical protein
MPGWPVSNILKWLHIKPIYTNVYIKYPFNVLLYCGVYYVIILYKNQNSLFYKNGAGGGGDWRSGATEKPFLFQGKNGVGPQLDHSWTTVLCSMMCCFRLRIVRGFFDALGWILGRRRNFWNIYKEFKLSKFFKHAFICHAVSIFSLEPVGLADARTQ